MHRERDAVDLLAGAVHLPVGVVGAEDLASLLGEVRPLPVLRLLMWAHRERGVLLPITM